MDKDSISACGVFGVGQGHLIHRKGVVFTSRRVVTHQLLSHRINVEEYQKLVQMFMLSII